MRLYLLILLFHAFGLIVSGQEKTLEFSLQKGHSKQVTCTSFSPDGKYLATGSTDNSVIIWSLENSRQIRSINQHSNSILSVHFNNTGDRILTASSDNSAKVFNVLTGEIIFHLQIKKGELDQAFFDAKGRFIVLSDKRDGVYIYDANNGRFINQFKKSYSLFNLQNIFHPVESRILSANDYASFFVCDILTGDTLKEIEYDKAFQMSYSPDGKYIAVSSAKLFTQVFDAANYKLLFTLQDGDEQCDGCNTKHVFTPSSKFLLTMSSKVDAIVWDLSTGKKIKAIPTIKERPYNLKFSNDESYVLISSNEDLFVYDIKTGKEKLHLSQSSFDYFDFQFNGIDQSIAVPGLFNDIVIYEATGKKVKNLTGFLNKKRDDGLRFNYDFWADQQILKYINLKREATLSPDGKSYLIGNIDSSAFLVDINSGKIIHHFSFHRQMVIATAFSPDGKLIATAGGDRKIAVWDAETGKLLNVLKGHQEVIFDLKFKSDGKQLVSASWDGSLRIWNLDNPGEFVYISTGNYSPYTVGFTKDNLYAVTGDLEKNIDFYEVDAAESFRTLVGHTSTISDFSFSSDGKFIATSSWDGKVKVFDILTGMLVAKLDQHDAPVYCSAFHPKENIVVSGGASNQIIIWNISTSKFDILKGHTSPVTSLQFDSTGKYLLSCDADGVVKLWDYSNSVELYSRIQISRNEWLATTSRGNFDGTSKSFSWVNYVSGMEVMPVGSVFETYHTPDLISKVMSGTLHNERGENIHQIIKTSPQVSFELASGGVRSTIFNDTVLTAHSTDFPLFVRINSYGESITEIRIYNNGKLIEQENLNGDLTFRGGDKDVRSFSITLSPGENNIQAIAINENRTESAPAELKVNYDGKPAPSDLFILAVGINNYLNPKYNLEYAVNDAKAFTNALITKADSLFEEVKLYSLFNEMAIKPNIQKAVEEIKSAAGPEDVFVFYYAGHGVMSVPSDASPAEFFIVTHDVTNLYDQTSVLRQKAVSAKELLDFSLNILAEKQLFLLDACHSGGAVESFATRGDSREKTLAQLARSTGTFFITAAQDVQYANEVGNLQHGLFTYALLEVLNGQFGNNGDDKITISELKIYVEERVPELSEEHHGSPQYPTGYSFGQDFPIVILK